MSHAGEEKPCISVIVPVYNGQDYLRACIESIVGQTYGNLEVIIVNDGSSDKTGDLCRSLAGEYENIQIIETNDEGVSTARNAGLDKIRGEFVTFVDADDRILPDMIEKLYYCMTDTGSDVAGCGFFSWREEGEFAQAVQSRGNKEMGERMARTYTASEFVEDGILKGNSRCWSKLYRVSAVGGIRFRPGLTIGEDMLFLVDMLPGINRISEIAYKGYGYFQNPKGAMNRAFLPKYMDQITCWETAREKIAGISGNKDMEQVTAILIMAVLLTAGKIAMLPAKERKKQASFVRICHEKLKKELQAPGVYERLSGGYKVKAKVFAAVPWVYLWLYHFKIYKR
ncbi:MAG: glycosyltransferase [Lachnospiraceae bacterium]|nr:glycosyltransferase [Lachnospiraceae bacterium]